jgi:predicted ThiF/HesA family dinucleotide-utilizing enzyme
VSFHRHLEAHIRRVLPSIATFVTRQLVNCPEIEIFVGVNGGATFGVNDSITEFCTGSGIEVFETGGLFTGGTVLINGVMVFEGDDAAEVPTAFMATTVKVSGVPVGSPVTVIRPLPAPVTVPVSPPGLAVATYRSIAEPPSLPGAVKATVAV